MEDLFAGRIVLFYIRIVGVEILEVMMISQCLTVPLPFRNL